MKIASTKPDCATNRKLSSTPKLVLLTHSIRSKCPMKVHHSRSCMAQNPAGCTANFWILTNCQKQIWIRSIMNAQHRFTDVSLYTYMFLIYIYIYLYIFIKGSLDEKLPIYEQDPKSKRLDSFEKRFVRD